nr:hypothetical protein Itr_chr08CG12360 [Ipomoea trifida]GMD28318.1 hypothetical protein Iba_chr08eCG6230 [Ipomoea batatas]GMD29181.1 hypothetical protein Iba_chr08fCG0700 [Ipomoea batatas]
MYLYNRWSFGDFLTVSSDEKVTSPTAITSKLNRGEERRARARFTRALSSKSLKSPVSLVILIAAGKIFIWRGAVE